jgi:glycine/D-amino acid oxidase-like deaminating enzyme
VLAAGTGAGALCARWGLDLPLAASPALLIRVAAPPGVVRTIVATPHFEARELRDGHLLLTAPLPDPVSGTNLRRRADHTLQRLRSTFRSAGAARLIGWQLGHRPMPAGGPLVGYVNPDRSVYVAVMHSAITLGPTVGRLVADELATGEPAAELHRCRPRDRAHRGTGAS